MRLEQTNCEDKTNQNVKIRYWRGAALLPTFVLTKVWSALVETKIWIPAKTMRERRLAEVGTKLLLTSDLITS